MALGSVLMNRDAHPRLADDRFWWLVRTRSVFSPLSGAVVRRTIAREHLYLL